ncbi:MAG: phospholipase [Thermoleophilaceae bacterium]|nr:phospholipase [Thermoleophilaceae bacterium]
MAVEHVFVLMLENRSFDHMLGFSGITGNDAQSGDDTEIDGLSGSESNDYRGQSYTVQRGADWEMPVDPNHEFPDVLEQLTGKRQLQDGRRYPPIDDAGYVKNYASIEGVGQNNLGEILKCYEPGQLPVLTTLASEFVVCDSWWSSLPGPTWPNRFFAHAASSNGLDHSPSIPELIEWETVKGFSFPNGTVFDRLKHAGRSWKIYAGDWTPGVAALKGIGFWDWSWYTDFADDVGSGDYDVDYTWIEPSYGHITSDYACGTSQHPQDDVTRGERLIKCTYDALRASPVWDTSLLIVTYDEHGGFYDHATPPQATPPGDGGEKSGYDKYGFRFDQYGVRVPAVVVSPLIPRNLIDHSTYDHSSIPATLNYLFGLDPLTERDAQANGVQTLLSLSDPRTDTPEEMPDPAVSGVKNCRPLPPCGQWQFVFEVAEAPPPVTRPADSVEEGNLPATIHVALTQDLEVTPPEEQEERFARARAVETRADAREYLAEVERRLAAASERAKR